jgi:molybdate transport system substrate-binding protein
MTGESSTSAVAYRCPMPGIFIKRLLACAALAIGLGAIAGCGTGPGGDGDGTATAGISGNLSISAAASLQGAFTKMAAAFEDAHPQVSVSINFGASSTLARQIVDGAPVDVFASADQANMTKVADAELLSDIPTIFATNSLEIIVRKGNPSGIGSLADLAETGLIYVTCAPEVPIGRYAAESLLEAGVTVNPASFEPDVKGIVTKVSSGEADAGIVYRTDVLAAGDTAAGVAIPDQFDVRATYPQAVLTGSPNETAAIAWMSFVAGAEGQAILRAYGFGQP